MQHYAVLSTGAPISSVKVGVRSCPAPFDGEITRLVFSIGQPNAAGAAAFDFRVNGVSIFATLAERPSIAAGQKSVVVSGLNVVIEENDVLSWDAVNVPLGGLAAPVTCTAVLDDGEPAAVQVQEVDGAPSGSATLLRVANGDLQDLGGGVFRLRTAGDVALPTALPPSGPAGGDLSGMYPNPELAAGAVTHAEVAAANKDGMAVTPSMRTLGTGAQQACAGADARLSDSRAPSGAAGGDLSGAFPSPAVNQLKGRSLGGIPTVLGFIADDFSDNIFNSFLWSRSSVGDCAETNQRIQIQNSATMQWANRANFTGKSYTWKLTNVTSSTAFYARFYTAADNSRWIDVRFAPNAAQLRFSKHEAGDTHVTVSIASPYTDYAYFRVSHNSGTDTWTLETSPDGAAWTVRATHNSPATTNASNVLLQYLHLGGGVLYLDDVSSNVPATDPITGQNMFGLVWDNPNNQFALMQTLGAVSFSASGAPPSGPPANLPTGHTRMHVEMTSPLKLWIWNTTTSAWNSQQF